MFVPLAICMECLDDHSAQRRYLQCVTVPGGGQHGEKVLLIDDEGALRWEELSAGRSACELWSSSEQRVALLRRPGAVEVKVLRGDRSAQAPLGKPVLLLDQDELEIEGTKRLVRYRLHIHGAAEEVYAPRWYEPEGISESEAEVASEHEPHDTGPDEEGRAAGSIGERRAGALARTKLARAAAAALALGTAVGPSGCRKQRGSEARKTGGEAERHMDSDQEQPTPPDGGASTHRDEPPAKKDRSRKKRPPIEIRPLPPAVPPPRRRDRKPTK